LTQLSVFGGTGGIGSSRELVGGTDRNTGSFIESKKNTDQGQVISRVTGSSGFGFLGVSSSEHLFDNSSIEGRIENFQVVNRTIKYLALSNRVASNIKFTSTFHVE